LEAINPDLGVRSWPTAYKSVIIVGFKWSGVACKCPKTSSDESLAVLSDVPVPFLGFQSMSGPERKSEKWQQSITQPPISHPIVAMPLLSISEALSLVIGNF
jgi:hypothetical protein